jgi:UTP:GlnB (protein PII) uridylyltransferase
VLSAVLSGRLDARELRQRWASQGRLAPRLRHVIETRVRLLREPDVTDCLVLEVETRDRIGLLADIAHALWKLGYGVERSLIGSEGDRAIDIFYIQPQPQVAEPAESLPDALLGWLDHGDTGEPLAR